jgi:O-antigen/teichoic acid export membrane protein
VGNGRYATAANIYIWFDIIANFGLDMYLMREVSRAAAAGRGTLLVNTSVLRLLLYLAAAPAPGRLPGWLAVDWARRWRGETAVRQWLCSTSACCRGIPLPTGWRGLFRGFEKHEIPAAIQTVTTIVKVTLGVLALVAGLGIVGLAGASIVTNFCTLGILAVMAYRLLGRAGVRPALQVPPLAGDGRRVLAADALPAPAGALPRRQRPAPAAAAGGTPSWAGTTRPASGWTR